MPSNYKSSNYRNTNFTCNPCNPFRTKGYQTHDVFNESPRKPGSSYARPLIVPLYDDDHRLILNMNLENSTITVGNKIVFNGQKILQHGSPLSLKQLRAEAARWCWKYLRYIPDALIPGKHLTDDDYKVLIEALLK